MPSADTALPPLPSPVGSNDGGRGRFRGVVAVNIPAAFLAILGLALTVYAAMNTEPEDVWQRSVVGILGLALVIAGVSLL
jgi:hypothetical protein